MVNACCRGCGGDGAEAGLVEWRETTHTTSAVTMPNTTWPMAHHPGLLDHEDHLAHPEHQRHRDERRGVAGVAGVADETVGARVPGPGPADACARVYSTGRAVWEDARAAAALPGQPLSLPLPPPPPPPPPEEVYGLSFAEFKPLDAGGPITVEALKNGSVDVGLLFTSDPAIALNGFVLLADDSASSPTTSSRSSARTCSTPRRRSATSLMP